MLVIHLCMKDFLFLQSVSWHVLVVDEAHRLKNNESLLYRTLEQWDFHCHVLLTGTPIQNNLRELHALLAFIDRKEFRSSRWAGFVEKYKDANKKGVEPEPFEIGEHLVEASAKLVLIDRLLKWLHVLGHKVLLFSQMTHMLDVLQDYLGPVKVIRLIGKNTVEEIILRRAEEKLKLTDSVIEKGEFDTAEPSSVSKQALARNPGQLQDILKFGVDKLLNDETEDEDVDFSVVLGASVDGEWQMDEGQDSEEEEEKEEENGMAEEEETPQSMYMFEGHDYSKDVRDTSAEDREAFETLVALEKAAKEESTSGERPLRRRGTNNALAGLLPETVRKPRQPLTSEQLEARKKKRQEAAEKRAKKAAEEKERKRVELWKKHKYTSTNIVIDSEGEEEDEEEEETGEEGGDEEEEGGRRGKSIHYVMGDVTHPVDARTADNIIVHCAGNE
nr:hypothetical protein BaRGS_028620 [Batillaria attramentaria]